MGHPLSLKNKDLCDTSLYLLWCIHEYSNIRNFLRQFKEYIDSPIQRSQEATVRNLLHICLCVCVCVCLVKGNRKEQQKSDLSKNDCSWTLPKGSRWFLVLSLEEPVFLFMSLVLLTGIIY